MMELFPGWQYQNIIQLSFKELYTLRDVRVKRKIEERKAQEQERQKMERDRSLFKARSSILRK